jgi:outer membrane protein OmpA-like peptidoglycan-associated protein
LDKDFLRPLSIEKLDEVEGLLKKHASLLTLRIESHTDVRATYEYNEKLSEKRANSATKYLNKKGIESKLISSFWFSKSKLAVKCGDDVPCSESDHQLNRRSELTLHAFPDRNVDYDFPEGSTAADFETSEATIKWFINN